MPKKHDPRKIKEKRVSQERSPYPYVHRPDQLVNISIISMDPIFDLAAGMIQECALIFFTEPHFSHLHR